MEWRSEIRRKRIDQFGKPVAESRPQVYETVYPEEGELPFDSDRKMMSTLHRIDGENRMIVKGAVDRLLELTEWIWTKDGVREITEADEETIQRQNQDFSMEGLRVLAFTYREIPESMY